jgi:thioredoxin-dependent peroxiredoxin
MNQLEPGDEAPDFEARTDGGRTVKLSDYRGRKVILFFYPKDDTPGCTKQACGFRDRHADVEAHGAVVLGVSPDGVESHRKFKAKYSLPFPLLADEDHSIAERYGVWGQKSMWGRKYMGVVRSHFVIDEQGRVLEARVKVSPGESVSKAIQAAGG